MKRYKINELVYKCYEDDTLIEDQDGEWVKFCEFEEQFSKDLEDKMTDADPDYKWKIAIEKVSKVN